MNKSCIDGKSMIDNFRQGTFFVIFIGASCGITDGIDRFVRVVDGDISGLIVNEYNEMGEDFGFE